MSKGIEVIDVTRTVQWDGIIRSRISDLLSLGWITMATTATVSRVVSGGDLSVVRDAAYIVTGLVVTMWMMAVVVRGVLLGRYRFSPASLVASVVFGNAIWVATWTVEPRMAFDALVITALLCGASLVIRARQRWLLRIATPVGKA